jgi:superfamily II DNA or RNA helicase
MQISQSDVIRVRRARWRVLEITSYEECQVLVAAGVDATNAGATRRFVLPFDAAQPLKTASRPLRVPRRVWHRTLRHLLSTDTPPGALACATQAHIELLPHQLEPALAVVRGLGTRVLLADEVGLGKTVQAALIVAELQRRGAADRVLIITPAGLRDQWVQELSGRFGIAAALLDVRALRERSATLPVGLNPWCTVAIAVASVDYVKRPEVLSAVLARRWDVVVVDEAHGVAGDTERHASIAALATRASYVVLASATPHNGDRRSFAALCGLGEINGDRLLVFRRSRQDASLAGTRRVHRLAVRMNRDEVDMHALLLRFSRAVRAQRPGASPGADCWLALSVLHKRALSSAWSLHASVERRLASLRQRTRAESQLELPLGDPAGELTSADEPPPWPAGLALEDVSYEQHLLEAIAAASSRAARHETKIDALARLLRRIDEPAIVFTEYRDTLEHVRASLEHSGQLLHGGMTRGDRLAALDRFVAGDASLLLATDAAAEGLNLQRSCRLVVNLELPWNPMRLEQRIGRVDRIGQRRTVHVFHLIARASAEAQILSRLETRVANVHLDIGGSDPLSSTTSDVRPAPDPDLAKVTLDAAVEASRVAACRLFTDARRRRPPALRRSNRPLLSRAVRWRTRRAVAGRCVNVWQVAAADGTARTVGSTLVAMTMNTPGTYDDRTLARYVMRAATGWRTRTFTIHRAFSAARLVRERAVQEAQTGDMRARSGPERQSGLFERRQERARLAVAAIEETAADDSRARMRTLERSRLIAFSAPRLLLVLTP